MKKLKNVFIIFLCVFALGIIVVFGLSFYISTSTSSQIFKRMDSLPKAQTAIILGASVHSDGKLSPVLKERVDAGLALYRQGKIENFLLSGDNRTQDYDEVSAMRNYLIKRGVPERIIFMDPAGLNTYDSMYRSRDIFEVQSAVIVTQQFHLPRALFIAKHLDLNYIGFPADSRQYSTETSLRRREKLANFKAVYEILSQQIPNTMGKKTPITVSDNY